MLQGKTVVLGVTGSIAAYKIANLASMLMKLHADVHVIMTENATEFINPITFETLTGNKCLVDTFDRNFQFHVTHVSLGQKADVVLVAPASANIIGKIANGIADDMLSTTILSTTAPVLVSPAMNTHMFEKPVLRENLERLKKHNIKVIEPATGYLACGDIGAGKMPEPEVLLEHILITIGWKKDFCGKKVVVTAGPTMEPIDPVRFISNHSTGKMGYAIARAASMRGADVVLISGPVQLAKPIFVSKIDIITAEDMYREVMNHLDADVIIMAAAVADYKPIQCAQEKIKKMEGQSSIELDRTKDILETIGQKKKENQVLCGFSMETENLIVNTKKKLKKKNADLMIANNLKQSGAGFGTDTNVVTMITGDSEIALPIMSKEGVAHAVLDRIQSFFIPER